MIITKIKKVFTTLLIAGLGGISGMYIYLNYFDTGRSFSNISERQPIKQISYPLTSENNLTDFTCKNSISRLTFRRSKFCKFLIF